MTVPKKELGLFDSTNIIVGIIVGVGLYESTPLIAANVPSTLVLIGVWLFGGILSFCGALCYAELATTYPDVGGDYVYLSRAMGKKVAFLYGWTKLVIVRPGSIAAMAFVFGRYGSALLGVDSVNLALLSVVVLGGINILGVREGKWTQNFLTVSKVVGLGALIVFGLMAPANPVWTQSGSFDGSIILAIIFVLFAFGGWNEVAYVAAEVKNPNKNILRSLAIGTVLVTFLYVVINLVMVYALGFEGLVGSKAAASDVAERASLFSGQGSGKAMSLLISISALGAINGMIFTGARISYAMGRETPLFSFLGVWSERFGTPSASILAEGLITLLLIIAFSDNHSGFESTVMYTTPMFYLFMALVGFSLVRLRAKDPNRERPYQTPFYPFFPVVLLLMCGFMFYSSVAYAYDNLSSEVFWSLGIFLFGCLLLPFLDRPTRSS